MDFKKITKQLKIIITSSSHARQGRATNFFGDIHITFLILVFKLLILRFLALLIKLENCREKVRSSTIGKMLLLNITGY